MHVRGNGPGRYPFHHNRKRNSGVGHSFGLRSTYIISVAEAADLRSAQVNFAQSPAALSPRADHGREEEKKFAGRNSVGGLLLCLQGRWEFDLLQRLP